MSKNWKEERRQQRVFETEHEIKKKRRETGEDEKLIRMLETSLVSVSSGGRGEVFAEGRETTTRRLNIETPDDSILVEAGTNGRISDDGLTVVSISLLADDPKIGVVFDVAHGKVGLIFRGKNHLLEASAVLRSVGAIFTEELMNHIKSSEKKRANGSGGKR